MHAVTEPPFDPDYDQPRNTPPQDMAAEQAVLGALIQTPGIAPQLRLELKPGDFFRPHHETIYDACQQLLEQGTPLDPITLVAHLNARGHIQRVGGAPYIHTLIAACPNPATWDYYAHAVRHQARLRGLDTLAIKIKQAAQSAPSPEHIDQLLGDTLQAVEHEALRFGPTMRKPSSWGALDLTTVLQGGEIDPPPCKLERNDGQFLIYDGAVHTLSGEPGSGKSWITLLACLQEMRHGNKVTFLDFEDRASRVVGRLLGLGATPAQIRDRFRYVRPNAPLDAAIRPDLDAAIEGASLVVIDGVTEVMTLQGLDPNANSDVAIFYGLVPRYIANHGHAVIMIDHVVKDGERQGRWAIGGQHKLAGIDGVAYLVKAVEQFGRGKVGHARITVSKDRPGYVEEIALGRSVAELWLDARNVNVLLCDLKPPTANAKDDAGNLRPTHLMEKVSRWLEITPGANTNQIHDMKFGKKQYVTAALSTLIREGFVEPSEGTNRQRFHHVATPYREDES